MALAFVFIYSISVYLKDRAITDLAQDDARQISGLVFQSLYSAMSKGWNKDEIQEIITRLNQNEWEMKIRVMRGFPVIRQFGEIEGEKAVRQADRHLMEALIKGDDYLFTQGDRIRYIYPVKVKQECLRCHTEANVGDINGAIDIDFPVKNLKISLNFMLNVVSGYFALVLILIFVFLQFLLRFLLAKPLIQLVGIIQEIIEHTDLSRRLPKRTGWVTEFEMLSTYFNNMLSTMQDYSRQLEELSIRDPLTKLYNRRKFEQFLDYEVNRSLRHKHPFSLIMMDVDNFKHINDTYGHPIGDLALKEIANTLEQATRNTDIVARIGGDEFAIILPETHGDNAMIAARKIRAWLNEAVMEVPSGKIRMTASFGLVEFPLNGTSMADISIAMDVAMYKAKKGGKNRIATIEESDREMVVESYSQTVMVKRALDDDRVEAHFQPIVDVKTGKVFAYETLARIREGDVIIPASQFIEAAEEAGLSEHLDIRIIEKGIDFKKMASRLNGVKLFFNLSPRTFRHTDFMRSVPEKLKDAGVSPEDVVFEITEREALPHIAELNSLISDLHSAGIRFALDDFGSGFSSFVYLKYLTVDYIKIEGSFVRSIAMDPSDKIMVNHIHGMAKDFKIKSIAEFVEDEEAHKILKEMGVDYGQGYHYGKPVPGRQITEGGK
ncbi:MAG: EAL domain-containing protein [Nitrospinae bacterium]|nr:EAL domain-containing protein [Nitrospinota bacterium]